MNFLVLNIFMIPGQVSRWTLLSRGASSHPIQPRI